MSDYRYLNEVKRLEEEREQTREIAEETEKKKEYIREKKKGERVNRGC